MRWTVCLLAGLLLWPVSEARAETEPMTAPNVILPETTTPVALSNTDVNRLVCPEGIKDVFYSQEKGALVKISGNNAFIKFQVVKKGDALITTETPSEFHIVCGDDIYSLIGRPQRIPAQTIRLSSGKKQTIEQNLARFEGMPLEKQALALIRQAYTDQLPESYLVRTVQRPVELFPALRMRLLREILVEGEGLAVREYRLSLKDGKTPLRLAERQFLRSELTPRPLAIALDELLLETGTEARLFIVERRATSEPSPFVKPVPARENETEETQVPSPSLVEEGSDAP